LQKVNCSIWCCFIFGRGLLEDDETIKLSVYLFS
jgi:hypothetical protein